LAQLDAVVPPAKREELQELARHVERRSGPRALDAIEYKQIATLMERVGRYDQAMRALDRAEELESRHRDRSADTDTSGG
jgi:hypothetical protein